MTLPSVPHRGEWVRVDGRQGVYVVTGTEKTKGVANLELTDDPDFILINVPFSAIHSIKERGPLPAEEARRAASGMAGNGTQEP